MLVMYLLIREEQTIVICTLDTLGEHLVCSNGNDILSNTLHPTHEGDVPISVL